MNTRNSAYILGEQDITKELTTWQFPVQVLNSFKNLEFALQFRNSLYSTESDNVCMKRDTNIVEELAWLIFMNILRILHIVPAHMQGKNTIFYCSLGFYQTLTHTSAMLQSLILEPPRKVSNKDK